MKFFDNLTGVGKIVFLVIAALVIGGGIYYGASKLKSNGTLGELAQDHASSKFTINEDADVVIGYNTFIGVAPLVYANGGMEPNTEGTIFKKYGVKLQIKRMDNVADSREALKTGAIDAVYCTVDALPIEMGDGSALVEAGAKVRMKVNESRGADVLVVTRVIKSIADIKGKTVAYAVGTASHTLLLNILETAGLSMKDIQSKEVENGVEASQAFKTGAVDAALVWSPDDEDCVKAVAGAKSFVSTATATSIIADGLLITDRALESKKENLVKVMKAWLEANGEANINVKVRNEAAKLFAKGFEFDESLSLATADKVRYSTLGDNQAFFGLDATYTGVTGEKMYGRMSVKYVDAHLAKAPKPWSKVSDETLIDELGKDPLAKESNQSVESEVKFTAPTKAEEVAEAGSSKSVSITFPTASYTLDDYSKQVIDREVTGLAQGFAKARMRIEGNTDNVGDVKSNNQLSYRRAEAVRKYLVSEHKFDVNKFIVVGNGQSKPVDTNSTEEGRAKNRRTEFQFIF